MRYFHFVTSQEYWKMWKEVVEVFGTELVESLCFFITDNIFRELLHVLYPTESSDSTNAEVELTDDEQHALGYVGGYLIHASVNKIERANDPQKEQMIEALLSFKENGEDESEEDTARAVPEWTKIINRGRLYQCQIEYFDFLCAMECIVKRLMRRGCEQVMKRGLLPLHARKLSRTRKVCFFGLCCALVLTMT